MANKISPSSQCQGRKHLFPHLCGNRPGTNGWCFIFLKRFTRCVRAVSSAVHRTVKVRWIIHRVDRRWTRELTSSLGSRPHQHVNVDRRENEKEKERKTRKEKREKEEKRARLAFALSRVRIHLLCETVPFSLPLPLSFSIFFLFIARPIPDR